MPVKVLLSFNNEDVKLKCAPSIIQHFQTFTVSVATGKEMDGNIEKEIFIIKTEKERGAIPMGGMGAGAIDETWSQLYGLGKYLLSIIIEDPIPFILVRLKWELLKAAVVKSIAFIRSKKLNVENDNLVMVFNRNYFCQNLINAIYIIPIETSADELELALNQIPRINNQLKKFFKQTSVGSSFIKFHYDFLKRAWYIKS